jgi:hypothetical protein
VQATAVAMNKIADRDDRERDRMITQTAYTCQRIEALTSEMRDGHQRIELLIRSGKKDGG